MDDLDARLLETIQSHFPLEQRPFRKLADNLGTTEADVISRIEALKKNKVIRGIRAMFESKKLGYTSVLVAVKVERDKFDEVAKRINALPGVTHNYERDHEFNLWFTLSAPDETNLRDLLAGVSRLPGVLDLRPLPSLKTYKLRVEFEVSK